MGKVKYNVFLSLPCELVLKCSLDLRKFPFDTSRCPLNFMAWSYNTMLLHLDKATSVFEGITEEFHVSLKAGEKVQKLDNGEEVLTDILTEDVWYNFSGTGGVRCPTAYLSLTLERYGAYYHVNFIAPMIVLVLMAWLTFFIPLDEGDRVMYTITIMLNVFVLNSLTAGERPAVRTVMWLDYFQTTCFILIFVPTIETILLQHVHERYAEHLTTGKYSSPLDVAMNRMDRFFRIGFLVVMLLAGLLHYVPIHGSKTGSFASPPARLYFRFLLFVFSMMLVFTISTWTTKGRRQSGRCVKGLYRMALECGHGHKKEHGTALNQDDSDDVGMSDSFMAHPEFVFEFAKDELVEYYSKSRKEWIEAEVRGLNEDDGTYSLDVISRAPPENVRRRHLHRRSTT